MFLDHYGPTIAACYACATICERNAVGCLEAGQQPGLSRCIALAMDCAQMCRTAAALMSRNSDFVDTVCEACADVCSACAAECNHHDSASCRACAQACLRCARLCREAVQQTRRETATA